MGKIKEIDKKEDKIKRIAIELEKLDIGEIISPSTLYRKAGIHPSTGKDIMDSHLTFRDISFDTIIDKNGEVKKFIKIDDSINIKSQLREIKEGHLKMEKQMDEIKVMVKNTLNKK